MSEKFDIPYKSDAVPELLELGSRIKFNCHKGIACYNACCRQADITLTPYDIIRLKDRLGKSSTEFLREHTVPFQMERDGLPGVKLRTTDDGACLFMNEEGCGVYEDRPTACRYYPLGHMEMRATGASVAETHYFLVQEEHCKGHQEDAEMTVQEFLASQKTVEFDELNKEWLEIMVKKRSAGPTVGQPPESSLQMFFMCSYDMDRFRRFVLSDAFKSTYDLEESAFEVFAQEDISLMQFGVRLMKQVFFGERTIPEKGGVWEKRVEQRQEVWDARREVEIARKQQMEDEKYKDD